MRPTLSDNASIEQVFGTVQKLCREQNLTPYDALYVELALRMKCPLATGPTSEERRARHEYQMPLKS